MTRVSDLEETLAGQLRILGVPPPEREYRFWPKRRFAFDFAWPDKMLAVECEGGTWVNGAHNRGKHFASDCEKYNTATLLGWRVLRFNNHMVNDWSAAETIKQALEPIRET